MAPEDNPDDDENYRDMPMHEYLEMNSGMFEGLKRREGLSPEQIVECFDTASKNLKMAAEEIKRLQGQVSGMFSYQEQESKKLGRATKVLKMAYRKHVNGFESIGWIELGDALGSVLMEIMMDKEFQRWNAGRKAGE